MIPLPQEQQQSQHQESRTEAYQEPPDNIADNNIDNNRDNNNSNNTTDNNNNDSDGGNINNNNTVATVPSSSSSSSSSNNGDDDKDVNDLSSPPPYEQVPKMPLPVIVDVNGDDELPTYQQTVANSHSLNNRSPNTNNRNSRKDKTNRCVCCGVKNRRSKFCILIFALLVTLVIAITSIGVSNNKACYALGLNDDPNNVKSFSFDPNALNSFRIISSYVKSGTINVSQSNTTSALVRVQYNSLANDRIRIDENIFGNHYNLIFGSGSSLSIFGVNIPPKCIVANVQLTLPSTMNSTTNITTIDSDIFDLTFAENPNKYNQTLRIRGDDVNLQFNNLSVKSLSIDTESGIVNGTVKDIEDGIYVNIEEADLNLNVGIANNTNSTTINIIDYTGRVNLSFINGFTGKYDIFTETGRVITNGVEISNNQHVANVVNTSNNRFTNGTLTIRNTDGTVNVTF